MMDSICMELGIPRKQIKETKIPDRYLVLAHKSWIQYLLKHKKLIEFPIYLGLDEWPTTTTNVSLSSLSSTTTASPINNYQSWSTVFFNVYKKYNYKVVPLNRISTHHTNNENCNDIDMPQLFSQLSQNISQTNFKNLWKTAYKKYSSSRKKFTEHESMGKSTSNNKINNSSGTIESTINLIPYDMAFKEIVNRMYGYVHFIHSKLDKIKDLNEYLANQKMASTAPPPQSPSPLSSSSNNPQIEHNFEPHINLYPIISIIETNTHFILVHNRHIENTLLECVTFSPAIIGKSYNKPLFLIYQILQLMKTLNDRGLLLGNITLSDIYLTENLWLQLMPKLDINILYVDDEHNYSKNVSQHQLQSQTTQQSHQLSKQLPSPTVSVPIKETQCLSLSLKNYCEMWCHGKLSNFDYLMILNNFSGRRMDSATYHHIMPWITDFYARNGMNWRDLTKSKYRLNKGDIQLDLMFSLSNSIIGGNSTLIGVQEIPNSTSAVLSGNVSSSSTVNTGTTTVVTSATIQSTSSTTISSSISGMYDSGQQDVAHHVSDVLSDITYYVYMARRTSKTILCKYVRPVWVPAEYPASIQRLQEWTPDECIPEFFTDPLVFKSIHEDLPNLEVPVWSSCPEDFILKHREALESQYVSERLHHWIDINFGYKLTGDAAIQAKNVCLSLVDNHKVLYEHGIVQLFQHPHPSKIYQTAWTSKLPPRIYASSNRMDTIKRRLTRSSEDLSNHFNTDNTIPSSTNQFITPVSQQDSTTFQFTNDQHSNSPSRQQKYTNYSDGIDGGGIYGGGGGSGSTNIERSTSSYYTHLLNNDNGNMVNNGQEQIILPKDFNPINALVAIENMEIFFAKTFYHNNNNNNTTGGNVTDSNGKCTPSKQHQDIQFKNQAIERQTSAEPQNVLNNNFDKKNDQYNECDSMMDDGNAFLNRIFSEEFQLNLKLLLNGQNSIENDNTNKNQMKQSIKMNFKQLQNEHKLNELKILGCIICELFLTQKLRPLGNSTLKQTFSERYQSCVNLLKYEFELLPKCVQYPIRLLLNLDGNGNNIAMNCDGIFAAQINDKGLPIPTAQQLLEPILQNCLFPFPINYLETYHLIKSLQEFYNAQNLLEIYTYFVCDAKDCKQYEYLDRKHYQLNRKIAECMVKSCSIQIESLLHTIGYEQFNSMELILPHIIDLLKSNETSILTAYYLFDSIAFVLGIEKSNEHLMEPILHLYESIEMDINGTDRLPSIYNSYDNHESTTSSSSSSGSTSVGCSSMWNKLINSNINNQFNNNLRKTMKLYHHTFLLKLLIRFGLKRFLDNFIGPIIEAVGGYGYYKSLEITMNEQTSAVYQHYGYRHNPNHLHYHHANPLKNDSTVQNARTTKPFKYSCNNKNETPSPTTKIPSNDSTFESSYRLDKDEEEIFLFENESASSSSMIDKLNETIKTDDDNSSYLSSFPSNTIIDHDNSSNDIDVDHSVIQKIIDQFNINSDGSVVSQLDLPLNHSTAEEVTEDFSTIIDDGRPSSTLSKMSGENNVIIEDDNLNGNYLMKNCPTSPTIPIPPPTTSSLAAVAASASGTSSLLFRRSIQFNTIDCEIGSKKSFDSNDFLDLDECKKSTKDDFITERQLNLTPSNSRNDEDHHQEQQQQQQPTQSEKVNDLNENNEEQQQEPHLQHQHHRKLTKQLNFNRNSEISADSLIWLSHRLGPVLTARHISRNLLKMLTLCYVGQENLLPILNGNKEKDKDNLMLFSLADGQCIGDQNAIKVFECLTAISGLFGEQFILLQYFPYISELIVLCKKRLTSTLEGGLISSLQLLKLLIPCLCDSTIMDQLRDVILKNIIHPIIRLLGSSKFVMPNGYLARSILAKKSLDIIYVLAVRIGPVMTKNHLCVPALQRFFLIFDKAYGLSENLNINKNDQSPSNSSDESNFLEIRREGGLREWSIKSKGEPGNGSSINIAHAKTKRDQSDSITPPPPQIHSQSTAKSGLTNTNITIGSTAGIINNNNAIREKAIDEIYDVFTPQLAYIAYVSFLKYLGENIMSQIVKNLPLILNLCFDYNQPNYEKSVKEKELTKNNIITRNQNTANNRLNLKINNTPLTINVNKNNKNNDDDDNSNDSGIQDGYNRYSNSFGTTVIGNRLDVTNRVRNNEQRMNTNTAVMGPMELLDVSAYKFEQLNNVRDLKGNWLAYWEHEIGRSEKDNRFNLKQIKLQSFAGHTNSVRSILSLDNENSFMSASKDKTVKLWSLRSEGDGNKVSSCQYTYTNHRKSVHSLAFSESLRLTVSCDSGVHIWDPFMGVQIGQLDSHKYAPVSVVKTYPAPSPLVLAGTAEATLKIIDARTCCYVNEWKALGSGSVRCIAVSPFGTWIAVGLSTGQIILFDGRTGIIIANWKATDGELLQLITVNEQQIISSSLDHNICVWSTIDGSLLFNLKSPAEPAHCLLGNCQELFFGTPSNRIGIYPSINPDVGYSITKLRSNTFRGVLTSLAVLPLNRMLLIGGDSGNISLIC